MTVSNTAKRLRSMSLFVTDGLRLYAAALRKQYGKLQPFAPTGKRGRPQSPKLTVDELLKYAQVIKMRVNGRLKKVVTSCGVFFKNKIKMLFSEAMKVHERNREKQGEMLKKRLHIG